MIILVFRKTERYGCNVMFNSSGHLWKNYIEKLRSLGKKKRLLFTAKKSLKHTSKQSVCKYKRYIRV